MTSVIPPGDMRHYLSQYVEAILLSVKGITNTR